MTCGQFLTTISIRDSADAVIEAAERRERDEVALRAGIAGGVLTVELLGLEPLLARHGMVPR